MPFFTVQKNSTIKEFNSFVQFFLKSTQLSNQINFSLGQLAYCVAVTRLIGCLAFYIKEIALLFASKDFNNLVQFFLKSTQLSNQINVSLGHPPLHFVFKMCFQGKTPLWNGILPLQAIAYWSNLTFVHQYCEHKILNTSLTSSWAFFYLNLCQGFRVGIRWIGYLAFFMRMGLHFCQGIRGGYPVNGIQFPSTKNWQMPSFLFLFFSFHLLYCMHGIFLLVFILNL